MSTISPRLLMIFSNESWFFRDTTDSSSSSLTLGPFPTKEITEEQMEYYREYYKKGKPGSCNTSPRTDEERYIIYNDMSYYVDLLTDEITTRLPPRVDNKWYFIDNLRRYHGPFLSSDQANAHYQDDLERGYWA